MTPEISVIVPLYNEETNVPLVVEHTRNALTSLTENYEILLVNDGSRDGTAKAIAAACKSDTRIKGLTLRRNYGQTTAMMAGFNHASAEIIVAMDGDLQNDPRDIAKLVEKLNEGYDVVSGWRRDRKDDAMKRNFPSIVANRIISWTTGVKLHDFGCSLKAYRKSVADHLNLYGEMHRFIAVYAVIAGARLAEVEIEHQARIHGKSKYGLERSFKVILDMIVVIFLQRFSQKPMYLFGAIGGLNLMGGITAFLASIYLKIFAGKSFVTTPLPLVGGFLFIIGAVCVLLGLLAELSIRTYHESQNKPTYLISEKLNLDNPKV